MTQPAPPGPLSGRTILVPAARVGRDVLADLLARKGAVTRIFPTLRSAPPTDPGPLDRAVAELDSFAWVILAGRLSVAAFLERAAGAPGTAATRPGPDLAAIGIGAIKALRAAGLPPQLVPRRHTADAVVAAMGDLAGRRVLLVRGDRAPRELPGALEAAGAEVVDAFGFGVVVDEAMSDPVTALSWPLDLVALGNPSAPRFLLAGLAARGLEPDRCLAGVPVIAVGPATAATSKAMGLEPAMVSRGHVANLVRDLVELLS